jgi:peptidylprolyl isomerase
LAGCSNSDGPDATDDLSMSADAAAPDAATPAYHLPSGYTLTPFLSDDAEHSFSAAGSVLESGIDYQAVLETDAGILVIDLSEVETPITVNSFVWLTLHHFYDGIAFHRVISGFVAQGGDPNTLGDDRNSWGSGDPGYSFGLEIVPSFTYDAAGVVGMARADDPDSNGSQFYITLAAAHNLDGMYTIFGHLTEGLDVLPKIARGEPPATPTRMQRVYIVQAPRSAPLE